MGGSLPLVPASSPRLHIFCKAHHTRLRGLPLPPQHRSYAHDKIFGKLQTCLTYDACIVELSENFTHAQQYDRAISR